MATIVLGSQFGDEGVFTLKLHFCGKYPLFGLDVLFRKTMLPTLNGPEPHKDPSWALGRSKILVAAAD